ncbi:MAG: imidazolonepropionase-like amidohydrolase [Psychromonas sp.]|jgi:imidazolonepropionase-like amidohydrolase
MKFLPLIISFLALPLCAQISHPQNGVKETKSEYYALKNATILVSSTETLDKGTVLIHNDRIIDVGRFVSIPKGTVIIDCEGQTIVPSFIELNSNLGLTQPKQKEWSFRPQLESKKEGSYYWNESIHPEFSAAENYVSNKKDVENLQKMGYGVALTHVFDGVAQGTSALVSVSASDVHQNIIQANAAGHFSFDKGVSRQTYPSSQMGSIALLRQALYDLDWYNKNQNLSKDLSLDALQKQMSLPLFFETEDKWEILRAKKIADEFGLNFTYVGSGNEYQITDELSKMNAFVVLPIAFPAAYDVTDPYISRQIPLSQLKAWEMAPQNPALLAKKNIGFSLSSKGCESPDDFWGNLKKAIENGLSVEEAFNSLITSPAKHLKIDADYGTIQKGKKANFTIYTGNPFEEKIEVLSSWVNGEKTIHQTLPEVDIRGNYNLLIAGKSFPIEITGTVDKPKGKIKYVNPEGKDTVQIDTKIELSSNDVIVQFAINNATWNGSVNLKGKYTNKLGIFEGSGQLPTGEWTTWSGIKNKKFDDKEKSEKFKVKTEIDGTQWFPNISFGKLANTPSESIVIKNVTLWTNEEDGIIENGSILIANGKISSVGKNSNGNFAGYKVIDGKGMHVTPGIIDEHSHIAISKGVNEGGQAISAEVSIGDVVNPDDINIYRQLSGGVTAAQLLHGSANPVGGQSALIKLKWGGTPEDMLIDDAPKFIKFALGENVKQANWGSFQTVRFPQTRMGVEQVFYDGFNRAKIYEKEKATGIYHKDLELETLLEILKGERNISCHSYIQSEINMLMHVADSMGFKINTFTHILEGYKVADKMAAHGAGGSTFADWWAYKYEVRDAIPYNAKLMHDQGVVVAINSDDAEMGRRLNQEAAKTVKYGGLTQEQALKTVTLNPAKLLHLDDKMGSLKPGKDADVVLWSDHPLSAKAKAMITIVDGVILFDREADLLLQKRDAQERARILSEMQDANKKGDKNVPFFKRGRRLYHCDTMGEEGTEHENHH